MNHIPVSWNNRGSKSENKMIHILKGIILGFSIAAPVGPIGILCIRRTLSDGKWAGFSSGLGAACADGVYGSIAGFGVTLISSYLINHLVIIKVIGGLFLLFLGTKSFFTNPPRLDDQPQAKTYVSNFLSTFLLTLTNPLTILSFAAIISGLGFQPNGNSTAILLIIGIFIGSTTWWFLLSNLAGFLRGKINIQLMKWVNRFSGVIVCGFGLTTLVSLLKYS